MAAVDLFPSKTPGISGPYVSGAAITPHDSNELTFVTRAIYVGGAGAIKLTTVKGDTLTFTALPVGTLLPVRAKIVFSTNTTATNLLALW